jgi:hypothetical protein
MNPSLIQLSMFVPANDAEKAIYNVNDSDKFIIQEYLDNSKSSWSNGKYYLGGQIQLNPNDKITPELFKTAWKMMDDSGYDYTNSFEYFSVLNSKRGLTSIEKIVNKYIEIQKLRVFNELEKTTLSTDVNKEVMSFI